MRFKRELYILINHILYYILYRNKFHFYKKYVVKKCYKTWKDIYGVMIKYID